MPNSRAELIHTAELQNLVIEQAKSFDQKKKTSKKSTSNRHPKPFFDLSAPFFFVIVIGLAERASRLHVGEWAGPGRVHRRRNPNKKENLTQKNKKRINSAKNREKER